MRAGEGASDGTMAARSAVLARGCSVAAVIAAAEKRERAKREKGEEPNDLGFSGPPRGVGFDPAEDGARPSDQNQRPRIHGPSPAQAGASARRGLPAQAQVAAWVRPGRARGCWAEPVQRVLGRAGLKNEKKNKKFFFSYYFPETILNAYFDEFE